MTSGRAGRTRGTADEAPSIDYDPNRHVRRRTLGNDYINPLPDHLDPITLEKVEVPAISPAGVVMGMTSWQQCLEMKDETGKITKKNCPITRKKGVIERLGGAHAGQYRRISKQNQRLKKKLKVYGIFVLVVQ
eukprot:TRINITY_DN44710_c0_g1_i1.p1 TRINITY_DN44710_c0_g1~~TRINITY_DN44710_c0_g1_i1.p1  ORF type:complete len:133 (-),score=18.24 TRINITY_DN44710_c0_g1_i1:15-413(-)